MQKSNSVTFSIQQLPQKTMDSCKVEVENIFLLVIVTLISVLQNGEEILFLASK